MCVPTEERNNTSIKGRQTTPVISLRVRTLSTEQVILHGGNGKKDLLSFSGGVQGSYDWRQEMDANIIYKVLYLDTQRNNTSLPIDNKSDNSLIK